MIPVAAGALAWAGFPFNPMVAALCMSLSSLFVVGNALRLLLYKNKKLKTVKPQTTAAEESRAENQDQIEEEGIMKKIICVEGMCCQHCADRVEKALSAVSGVVSADVKLKKNIAVVRSRDEVSDSEITKTVEDAGYKVTGITSK